MDYSFKIFVRNCWKLLPVTMRSYALMAWAGLGIPKATGSNGSGKLYVVGFFRAATGLGQSARLYYHEALAAGEDPQAIDLTTALLQKPVDSIWTLPLFDYHSCRDMIGPGTVVIHVNPPVFLLALRLLKPMLDGKRVVAYWAWELMDVPRFWKRCLSYVDGIEVPSIFCAQAFSNFTSLPIFVHPHAVPACKKRLRKFAQDGVVRVLCIFDIASNFYRKNPLACIQAFKLAFGLNSKAQLFLKVTGLNRYPPARRAIEVAIYGWNTITLCEQRLSEHEMKMLYEKNDIFFSLHCAEGYGLTIREAMQYGMYVVATGWSGNMDFMHGDKCYAIPYRLTSVVDSQNFFSTKKQFWAQANIVHAAKALQSIVRKEIKNISIPLLEENMPAHISSSNVSIIIVNFQNWSATLHCLKAVIHLRRQPQCVIVVDNGSHNDSVGKLFRGWSALCRKYSLPAPEICTNIHSTVVSSFIILALRSNVGFAAANNIAIQFLSRRAYSRAFWFLNPDTYAHESALEALCDRLNERPDAGMAGSLLVDMKHPQMVQCAGGGKLFSLTGLTKNLLQGEKLEFGREVLPEFVERSLSFLTAASLLIRSETFFAVGGMSEDYFLYYEDVDLSLRVRHAHFNLVFANKSVVLHKSGGSSSSENLAEFFSIRNRLILIKHFFPLCLPFALIRQIAAIVKVLVCGNIPRGVRMLSAMKDFMLSH